jgi:hypothetical protein
MIPVQMRIIFSLVDFLRKNVRRTGATHFTRSCTKEKLENQPSNFFHHKTSQCKDVNNVLHTTIMEPTLSINLHL